MENPTLDSRKGWHDNKLYVLGETSPFTFGKSDVCQERVEIPTYKRVRNTRQTAHK
jgi:hypothetical protein